MRTIFQIKTFFTAKTPEEVVRRQIEINIQDGAGYIYDTPQPYNGGFIVWYTKDVKEEFTNETMNKSKELIDGGQ